MIIGWSLINSSIETNLFSELQNKILLFKRQGFLNYNDRIAFGQKCLDEKYRGKGIVERMTSIQDSLVSQKYDIYIATVKKHNKPSEVFFKKNSFTLFFEDDIRYYFSKPINQKRTSVQQIVTIEVDGQNIDINIRPGRPGDEFKLHELNKKWVKEARGNDFSKGFLTSLYSPNEFRIIIDAQEIVIAEVKEQNDLIGWCLTNNTIENSVNEFSKRKVEDFTKKGIIEFNQSVALGLQWLIDYRFQGKGLIKYLFNAFKEIVKSKYQVIEASVRKQNLAGHKATNKLGMITVDEDEMRYYKIITT